MKDPCRFPIRISTEADRIWAPRARWFARFPVTFEHRRGFLRGVERGTARFSGATGLFEISGESLHGPGEVEHGFGQRPEGGTAAPHRASGGPCHAPHVADGQVDTHLRGGVGSEVPESPAPGRGEPRRLVAGGEVLTKAAYPLVYRPSLREARARPDRDPRFRARRPPPPAWRTVSSKSRRAARSTMRSGLAGNR